MSRALPHGVKPSAVIGRYCRLCLCKNGKCRAMQGVKPRARSGASGGQCVKVTAAIRAGAAHRGRGMPLVRNRSVAQRRRCHLGRLRTQLARRGRPTRSPDCRVPRLGSFPPAVLGKKAGRGRASNLLGCTLEIEVPGGIGGRQDTNAAQHSARYAAVLRRIAGESIRRIDLFERAATVNVGFGHCTPLTRPRIGCSRGPRATPPTAAGT
jgi:hypothetical protein